MTPARAGSLLARLAQVPDPRGRQGRRFALSAMLAAVVCGLLCGVRGYVPLVEWLHDLPVEFWHALGFTRRPPQKDAFRDLLIRLDPLVLERLLGAWIEEELELELDAGGDDGSLEDGSLEDGSLEDGSLESVSLDGKTLCGTLRPFARAVHLLAAVDHRTGCVLRQCRVDEKTNEHKAALELLKTLVLDGRVIVGDAMFCQREVCTTVLAANGDYLLPVKENQPTLLRDIRQEFAAAEAAFSPLRPAAAAG